MKMVIAYMQSYVGEKVLRALQEVPEVAGASLMEIRGFGRGRGKGETAALATQAAQFGTLRKLRLEVMIPDGLEEKVVSTIRESAYTGHYGDGKIYVTKIDRAMRIRTGEEGDVAL